MAEAHGATEACDLFLAIGSSLRVYPAATLPLLARRWGAKLVIINNESTDFDEMADLVINRDIGETLSGQALALRITCGQKPRRRPEERVKSKLQFRNNRAAIYAPRLRPWKTPFTAFFSTNTKFCRPMEFIRR